MPLSGEHDTIVAISSGSGRAALGIVRLSGPGVQALARDLLHPYPEQPRHATLAVARHDGVVLDQLIAIRYEAPASYTGEAMLELVCHGGAASLRAVLGGCLALGARSAQPGEFTQRAVLNGRMDLAQAEAVADLIDAASEPMRRVALGVVGGGLSARITALRDKLLEVEALVAYSVDFPEEDDGEIPRERVLAAADEGARQIAALHETAARGDVIRDGALVVFAGPPNAGKSSLFNALLGHDRAIVTDIPGTTRDAVEHSAMIGDWPVRLVDTAGLRPSQDLIERLGIEVSERYLRDAHVTVACSDGSGASLHDVLQAARGLGARKVVGVNTKADLRSPDSLDRSGVTVSAVTGTGLAELRQRIAEALDEQFGSMNFEAATVTSMRHAALLARSLDELRLFREATAGGVTPTIAAVHLRSAVVALEEIVGAVSVDDLLDQVFSRFCIGK